MSSDQITLIAKTTTASIQVSIERLRDEKITSAEFSADMISTLANAFRQLSSEEDQKKLYKKLSLKVHPDRLNSVFDADSRRVLERHHLSGHIFMALDNAHTGKMISQADMGLIDKETYLRRAGSYLLQIKVIFFLKIALYIVPHSFVAFLNYIARNVSKGGIWPELTIDQKESIKEDVQEDGFWPELTKESIKEHLQAGEEHYYKLLSELSQRGPHDIKFRAMMQARLNQYAWYSPMSLIFRGWVFLKSILSFGSFILHTLLIPFYIASGMNHLIFLIMQEPGLYERANQKHKDSLFSNHKENFLSDEKFELDKEDMTHRDYYLYKQATYLAENPTNEKYKGDNGLEAFISEQIDTRIKNSIPSLSGILYFQTIAQILLKGLKKSMPNSLHPKMVLQAMYFIFLAGISGVLLLAMMAELVTKSLFDRVAAGFSASLDWVETCLLVVLVNPTFIMAQCLKLIDQVKKYFSPDQSRNNQAPTHANTNTTAPSSTTILSILGSVRDASNQHVGLENQFPALFTQAKISAPFDLEGGNNPCCFLQTP